MTTLTDARDFLVELISQLFHADVLITEQSEGIDALEVEIVRLRESLRKACGMADEWRAWPSRGAGTLLLIFEVRTSSQFVQRFIAAGHR